MLSDRERSQANNLRADAWRAVKVSASKAGNHTGASLDQDSQSRQSRLIVNALARSLMVVTTK